MELIKRLYFSWRMLRQNRNMLAEIYRNSPGNYQLSKVSPTLLKQQGVMVLVLDFDGVLAADDEPEPSPELYNWLGECIRTFGPKQVFILTNKPLPSRIAYFQRHFAGVRYVVDVKKKPYPDGLQKIMALTGQPSEALRLVDDRLLTGGLAACIANVPLIYITRPYISLSQRPLPELFFMTLRFLERRLIQLYGSGKIVVK